MNQYETQENEPSSLHQLNPYEYLPVRNDEKIDVKVIDHAHTLPNSSKTIDESYLYSLQSLISHLEEIYSDIKSNKLVQIDNKLVPALLKGIVDK